MKNPKNIMIDIFNRRILVIVISIIVTLSVGFVYFSSGRKDENNMPAAASSNYNMTTAFSSNELKEYDDVRTAIMGGRDFNFIKEVS